MSRARTEQASSTEEQRATVLSIFTGVGGLDLGLEAASFSNVGCVELDSTARRTLKQNRGEDWPLVGTDVGEVAEWLTPAELLTCDSELTLLAGGPPCQPYSKAAMWSPSSYAGLADSRAIPLHAFLHLVHVFLPRAVLIENVPGFVRGTNSALVVLDTAFSEINRVHGTCYRSQVHIIDALAFGVPQKRTRAIVTAFRDGEIFDLAPGPDGSRGMRAWDALRDLRTDEPAPQPQGRWTDLLASIPEGQNYLWHTNRGGGLPLFGYRTRYWSFLLKLAKNAPAWTLPAQPGPSVGPFHWENRPLRIAEMLRLQSFPGDWVVEGSRREQVRQVGNATPPLLAEQLGRAIRNALGLPGPSGPLKLRIKRARAVPEPEPVTAVPRRYRSLVGKHPDHPGEGLGPKPRPVGL